MLKYISMCKDRLISSSFFFFSSRRRHTRLQGDWSSDVCSSDLLINISTRGYVGTGSETLIGGFVVSGTATETVLLRGVGPTLGAFGVTGYLVTPQLTLFDNAGNAVATNIGWGNASVAGSSTLVANIQKATSGNFSTVGAFSLPSGSADSAMVVTLPSGSYTLQVTGTSNSTGIGLLEAYEMP